MRSKRISFRCPWIVCDRLEKDAARMGFRSVGRLMLGACLILMRHETLWDMVLAIANSDPKKQDEMISTFLKLPADILGKKD